MTGKLKPYPLYLNPRSPKLAQLTRLTIIIASNADNIAFLVVIVDNAAATSSSYSLFNIPILEKDNWAAFIKTVKAWLIMSHYNDLITMTEPE